MTPVNGAPVTRSDALAPRLRLLPDPGPAAPADAAVAVAEARAADAVRQARAGLPDLDPAVFACYLGRLALALDATTEADPVAVLASLLATTGVRLGQGPHVRAGDDRHPLLVWPLVIGRTNDGRKGSSWGTARRLLTAADPDFMTANVRSGLTSGEGLAALFADNDPPAQQADDEPDGGATKPPRRARQAGGLPPGDRRLLVFEPEWAAVMARMKREGNSLSATLRAAWEGGDLSTLTVTARVAPTSHVGLLAHITPDEFRAKVSASDLAGGTYNRFLPLAVARTKFLPLTTGADPDVLRELGAALADRVRQAAHLDTLTLTPDGEALWRQLYVEFGSSQADSGAVEQFISRAAPNCLRIAAIHAALEPPGRITADHLAAASALVRYSIESARTTLGPRGDDTTPRLLAWIADAGPTGRTRDEVRSGFFGRNRKAADVAAALDHLVDAGQLLRAARPRADGRPGRPTEVYTAPPPEQPLT